MKIIKQGIPPDKVDLDIRVTCPTCNAQFAIETFNDVHRVTSGSDPRSHYDYPVVVCPCCEQHIKLEERQFPVAVYKRIKTYRE